MPISNPWFLAALIGIVGWFHVKLLAELLNLSRLTKDVPEPLRDLVTDEDQERTMEYHIASTKLDVMHDAMMLAVFIAFWWLGGFQALDSWTSSFGLGPIQTGLMLISVLMVLQSLLNLPFAWWSTFKVEAAFGFNKTTLATFIGDRVKGILLGAMLGLPLLALVLWLFEQVPYAALWAWVVVSLGGLIMSWLSPRLIAPLFLKFTPLEDAALRRAIMVMAEKLQFPVGDISIVDGSRRSTKANAFFTGFGNTRRIALFDTLLTTQSEEGIVGVLAHEIGHAKLKHVPKQIAVGLAQSALMFGLLHFALQDARLFSAFGVVHASPAIGMILFSLVYGPWSHLLDAPLQGLTRKHEFEADRFAAQSTGSPLPLMEALKKLSKDHLSHLTPHPFYVKLHYSHPPLLERLKALADGA
ncbi:MAG: Ste24 endopeptidase [Verrucomicrobiaceae bacterium]|nr:Ste24 endopeptidase [Verrucomicrobiaceae bacterium]